MKFKKLKIFFTFFLASIILLITINSAYTAQKELSETKDNEIRIGLLLVLSGPGAPWGLSNKYAAEASANIWNKKGGLPIDGKKYQIKLFTEDDKNDPKIARLGAEKLINRDKVHFIIGPNCEQPTAAALEVTTPVKMVNIHYGWLEQLVLPPNIYSIFGNIASYQSAPLVYSLIKDKYPSAKKLALVSRNDSFQLQLKDLEVKMAKKIGFEVVMDDAIFEIDTVDFFPLMTKVLSTNPDVVSLTVEGSPTVANITKTLRQLGFKGVILGLGYGDEAVFNEVGGDYMEGYICIGGSTPSQEATEAMIEFMSEYEKIAGEWNDEAATKVYALEMILATIQTAGSEAIYDSDVFIKAMPNVEYKNPFIQGTPIMKFVGKSIYGRYAQIGMPVVINEVRDGKLTTLKIGSLEELD